MRRLLASICITAVCQVPALAADPSPPLFAPGAHKLQNGQPNELMVLGSPHLSQMSKSFDLAKLSLLNGRPTAWQPQAVAIESLSGLQCGRRPVRRPRDAVERRGAAARRELSNRRRGGRAQWP